MSKIFPEFVRDVANGIEITAPASYGSEPKPLKMANGTASTMWDIFNYYCREYKDRNFLGVRPYNSEKEEPTSKKGRAAKKAADVAVPFAWVTYEKAAEVVETISGALGHIGVKRGDIVAICGPNSPEYYMLFWAIVRAGCVPAPILMSTSVLEFSLILRQAPIKAMFVTGQMFPWLVQTMNSLARDELTPTIRSVVFLPRQPGLPDYVDAAQAEEDTKEFRWRVYSFQSFLKLGKKANRSAATSSSDGSSAATAAPAIGADDPFVIFFSNNVVGAPRGVCITHKSAVNASALVAYCPAVETLVSSVKPKDLKYVSSRNLAYSCEMVTFFSLMRLGFAFAFSAAEFDSPEGLFLDYKEVEPLLIVATPQMLRLFRESCEGHFCLNSNSYKSGVPSGTPNPQKLRKMLGSNLKFVMTSGAPVSVETAKWFRKNLGLEMSQAYALTETCCMATYSAASADTCVDGPYGKIVSCGYPYPGITIQLRDCPEAGIVVKGQKEIKGEIYVRTPAKFGGYLDDEDLTEYVYGSDGFIRTGDIGVLNTDGSIAVIDRVCPSMKVQSGSTVPYSVIETILSMTPLVNNIIVYTNPLTMISIAIVSASIDGLDDCAMLPSTARDPCAKARTNPKSSAPRKLLELPEIQELYLREFDRIEEENAMAPFYRIHAVILDAREWTEENGFATETGKVRRNAVIEKFKDRIDAVFKELLEKKPELMATQVSRAEDESADRMFLFLTDKARFTDLNKATE